MCVHAVVGMYVVRMSLCMERVCMHLLHSQGICTSVRVCGPYAVPHSVQSGTRRLTQLWALLYTMHPKLSTVAIKGTTMDRYVTDTR